MFNSSRRLTSIYIKRFVSESVSLSSFLFVPGGQTFFTHRREGDKHFLLEVVVAMMIDDVDEEMDVS